MIFMITAYALLFISIVSFVLGFNVSYFYYWVAAFAMYIFSFLGGFSVGQITVGFTFIPLILAIGHTLGWIQNRRTSVLALIIGISIGLVVVIFARTIIFYPLIWLFS